jgi:predicted metal-dependent enzyme (double-stranded beta helix superfamily)
VSRAGPIHPDLAPLARAAKGARPQLAARLAEALGRPRWLRPEHRVGDPGAYMRHLLYVDPDGEFVITAITWLPGQASRIHGHQVWCTFGVAEGELTEEQFRDSGGALEPLKRSVLGAGEVAEEDAGGCIIHRVSNRGRVPLVSLHLYGVGAERLTTGINRIYG